MTIEAEVRKHADEIAQIMRTRRQELVRKRADLIANLADLDAELAVDDRTDERLAAFQPKIGDDDQCPYCWMYERAQRRLVAVGQPEGEVAPAGTDYFRCEYCSNRYESEPAE